MTRRVGIAIVALAAACSTFSSNNDTTPPPGDDSGTDAGPDAIVGEPDTGIEITVDMQPTTYYLLQGATQMLGVTVARHRSSTGSIAVQITGLPSDVMAPPITIPAGQSTGTFTFTITEMAKQGSLALGVDAAEAGGARAQRDLPSVVRGKPGTVDMTFGTNGVASMFDPHIIHELAPVDDKLLVNGVRNDYAQVIMRLDATGKIDTTFGSVGTYNLGGGTAGSGISVITSGTLKGDIAAFLAGASTFDVMRLDANGNPILTYGNMNTGKVVGALGTPFQIGALPTGEVVLPGTFPPTSTTGIVEFGADGTFMGIGGPQFCRATGAAGAKETPTAIVMRDGASTFLFMQMAADVGVKGCAGLSTDTTIGSMPDYFVDVGAGTYAQAAIAPANGAVVLVFYDDAGTQTVGWFRISSTGVRDTSIGSGGLVKAFAVPGIFDGHGNSIAAQADGKVLVAGNRLGDPSSSLAVARFGADGTPDTSFGTNGVAIVDNGNPGGGGNARVMRIRSDGRIIVGGDGATLGTSFVQLWP